MECVRVIRRSHTASAYRKAMYLIVIGFNKMFKTDNNVF